MCENAQAPYGNIVSIVNLHLNKNRLLSNQIFQKKTTAST